MGALSGGGCYCFPFPHIPAVWLYHQTFSREGKQVGRGLESEMTLASRAGLLPPGRRAGRGTVEGQYLEGLDQFCHKWLQGNPYSAPRPLWVQPSGQDRVHKEIDDILVPGGRRQGGRDPWSTKGDSLFWHSEGSLPHALYGHPREPGQAG